MNRFFIPFFIVISSLLFSQKTISGTVKNEDGDAVPSASVTVEEPGKDAIIAYTISNAKGEYKLTFTSAEPNVDLKIKAFNHKTHTKSIKNENQTIPVTLNSEATEIKEVKLKTRLITKKGDTITYDLKAFESKADRTVADVLKKIPGIEVNKDGTVLYQGEAINKFYVNGKDLMEGGYGAINNSLPKDAVQKVEVMENHQPVKILQDKVPSEQAAINIQLKNKVTTTGRGEAGTGIADPWLWNLKLTPMFFGQKNQWIVNYKTNNTGETVENEGNMLAFGNRWEGRRVQAGQNDWLNVETAQTPGLPEKRYLMNNVHFVSANLLTNPFKNKEWEFKANANYTNNVVERESYSQTRDLQLGNVFYSNYINHFYTDTAKGEIIFTKNAKKGFFKNTTTFSQFWNGDRALADVKDERYGARIGREAIESPTTNFQNSLSTVIPWKEKLVNVMSYLHYQKDRQTLEISPASYAKIPVGSSKTFDFGTGTDRIFQDFSMNTFEAYHSANVSFIKASWTITPEVGFNYQNRSMASLLTGEDDGRRLTYGTDFQNDLKYINAVPYGSVRINFKSASWNIFSNLPLNFNSTRVEDKVRNDSKTLDRLTFEPNVFAQYSFASFWKASVNANINNSFGDINDVYAGSILTSPQNFSFMPLSNPIVQTNNKSAGARIEYRNPLNNLFFNVGYRQSWNKRNLTSNILTEGLGTSFIEYLVRDYKTENRNFSAEVGKYFPDLKTNASVGYSQNSSTSNPMRNYEVSRSKNNTEGLNLKFNNTYFSWMSLDYILNLSTSRQTLDGDKREPNKGYNHNLAVFFYPWDNHIVSFNWDQINSAFGGTTYHNAFYDLAYQYTWPKKKIDFELKWLNIANRKVFERFSQTAFTESFSRIQLRPSQVMLTVKFNFK